MVQYHVSKVATNLTDIIEQRGNLVGDQKCKQIEGWAPGPFEDQQTLGQWADQRLSNMLTAIRARPIEPTTSDG